MFAADAASTVDEAAHHRAMETLRQLVHDRVEQARESDVSVLNLVREIGECGRHWLRVRAAWNGAPPAIAG